MVLLAPLYKSDILDLQLNKEKRFLKATWLDHPSHEDFKKGSRIITEYIIQKNINKVLFDVRNRNYTEVKDQIADQSWLEQVIAPLIKNIANLRFAYLITQESYETLYTNHIHGLIIDKSKLFKNVEVGIFLEVQEAQDWLLNY